MSAQKWACCFFFLRVGCDMPKTVGCARAQKSDTRVTKKKPNLIVCSPTYLPTYLLSHSNEFFSPSLKLMTLFSSRATYYLLLAIPGQNKNRFFPEQVAPGDTFYLRGMRGVPLIKKQSTVIFFHASQRKILVASVLTQTSP